MSTFFGQCFYNIFYFKEKYKLSKFNGIKTLKKKTLWPFFIDWVQLSTEPLRGDGLLFTTQTPRVPGIHLIDLKKMKG